MEYYHFLSIEVLKMEAIKERLVCVGKKGSIHGLRFVVDNQYSITTRISWFLILILSGIATLNIFKASYISYVYHGISFATETTYLHWNTTFPAVSICEVWYSNKYWEKLDKYNPQAKSSLQEYLAEVIFFTGQCYNCEKLDECPDCPDYLNLTETLNKLRNKCEDIFIKCWWKGIIFNCCDQFLPLTSEYGTCYSINSIHTKSNVSRLDLVSNRQTGPGYLEIQTTNEDFMISIHPPEDVPFINQDPTLKDVIPKNKKVKIIFSVNEISNDEGVRFVDIEHRGCLYPDEVPDSLKAYNYFSYSTCVVQCRINGHLKFCNCTHHLMPTYYSDQFCNVSQLTCLTKYYETLNRIRPAGQSSGKGLVCECMPSCVEPNYDIVLHSLRDLKNADEIRFTVKMQALPSQKFKRNVVRNKLDLIVSAGGTLGLFYGASVLSLIEIFYLFFIRKMDKKPIKK